MEKEMTTGFPVRETTALGHTGSRDKIACAQREKAPWTTWGMGTGRQRGLSMGTAFRREPAQGRDLDKTPWRDRCLWTKRGGCARPHCWLAKSLVRAVQGGKGDKPGFLRKRPAGIQEAAGPNLQALTRILSWTRPFPGPWALVWRGLLQLWPWPVQKGLPTLPGPGRKSLTGRSSGSVTGILQTPECLEKVGLGVGKS